MIILFLTDSHETYIKNLKELGHYGAAAEEETKSRVKCISCCGKTADLLDKLFRMQRALNPDRKDHLVAFYENVKNLFNEFNFKFL